MNHMVLFALGTIFWVTAASAQVCVQNAPAQNAQSILASMVRPSNMAGSCALDQERGASTWKTQLPAQVTRFIEKNIYSPKKGMNPRINQVLDKDLFSAQVLDLAGSKNRLTWNVAMEETVKDPKIAEKLVGIAKQKRCAGGVDFQFSEYSGMYTEVIKNNDEKKARAELEETLLNDETTTDRVVFCSPIVKRSSALVEAAGTSVAYDIPKDLFFADNQSTLPKEKMDSIKAALVKKLTEPDENCKKKVIDSIDIITSSNLMANSDAIGRWDFKSLSDHRANFIVGQLADLFADQKENPAFPRFDKGSNFESVTTVDSNGENGDGTSGVCPYQKRVENGLFIVERDPKIKAADVAKNKYAKINVGISCVDQSKGGKVVESKAVPYFASQCYSIQVSCQAN
jgi:hypothetical protein